MMAIIELSEMRTCKNNKKSIREEEKYEKEVN